MPTQSSTTVSRSICNAHNLFKIRPSLQTSDFRLQTSDFRLQTSDFRLQTSDFRLQTSDFRLQTSDFKAKLSCHPRTRRLFPSGYYFRLITTGLLFTLIKATPCVRFLGRMIPHHIAGLACCH
ncbi:hypothetical protein EAE96_007470 [Botrytis aclada]|nr:hypothetical protein EAE96_007470 [Botrytis aclada]